MPIENFYCRQKCQYILTERKKVQQKGDYNVVMMFAAMIKSRLLIDFYFFLKLLTVWKRVIEWRCVLLWRMKLTFPNFYKYDFFYAFIFL